MLCKCWMLKDNWRHSYVWISLLAKLYQKKGGSFMIDCTENCTLYTQTLVFFKLLKSAMKASEECCLVSDFSNVFTHGLVNPIKYRGKIEYKTKSCIACCESFQFILQIYSLYVGWGEESRKPKKAGGRRVDFVAISFFLHTHIHPTLQCSIKHSRS